MLCLMSGPWGCKILMGSSSWPLITSVPVLATCGSGVEHSTEHCQETAQYLFIFEKKLTTLLPDMFSLLILLVAKCSVTGTLSNVLY